MNKLQNCFFNGSEKICATRKHSSRMRTSPLANRIPWYARSTGTTPLQLPCPEGGTHPLWTYPSSLWKGHVTRDTLWTDRQTSCENITFPQIHLRVVNTVITPTLNLSLLCTRNISALLRKQKRPCRRTLTDCLPTGLDRGNVDWGVGGLSCEEALPRSQRGSICQGVSYMT